MVLWIFGFNDVWNGLDFMDQGYLQRTSCCHSFWWENGLDDHGAVDFMNCVVFDRVCDVVL